MHFTTHRWYQQQRNNQQCDGCEESLFSIKFRENTDKVVRYKEQVSTLS